MQKDTLYGVIDGKSMGSCSDRALGVKTDLLFDGVFGSYVNSTLTILRRGSGLFRRILSFRLAGCLGSLIAFRATLLHCVNL
jgi:hypothetical protein